MSGSTHGSRRSRRIPVYTLELEWEGYFGIENKWSVLLCLKFHVHLFSSTSDISLLYFGILFSLFCTVLYCLACLLMAVLFQCSGNHFCISDDFVVFVNCVETKTRGKELD